MIIVSKSVYDEVNQQWTVPFVEKAGRHQKVEEIIEDSVYIQGIDGPMALMSQSKLELIVFNTKKSEVAKKKRKVAAQHAINEFALVSDFVKKSKSNI